MNQIPSQFECDEKSCEEGLKIFFKCFSETVRLKKTIGDRELILDFGYRTLVRGNQHLRLLGPKNTSVIGVLLAAYSQSPSLCISLSEIGDALAINDEDGGPLWPHKSLGTQKNRGNKRLARVGLKIVNELMKGERLVIDHEWKSPPKAASEKDYEGLPKREAFLRARQRMRDRERQKSLEKKKNQAWRKRQDQEAISAGSEKLPVEKLRL